MTYLFLKTVHILAVVLFVGNITTGVMWKYHADRSGDPRLMAHALAGIIRSDRWFTMPGVALIVITGLLLAMIGRFPVLGTLWIWMSLALLVISGVIFMRFVAPVQKRLLTIASGPDFNAAEYRRLSAAWMRGGAAALLAPVLAIALMVFKPVL